MSNKVIEFVKEHPYGVAAGVFMVGVLFLLMRGSGSSATASGVDSTTASLDAAAMQASTQLQLAQIQATAQNNQTSAAANVANQQTAAQVSVAQIQANTSTTNTTTVAGENVSIAQLQAQTQQLASTLTAQVENNQTAALQAIALAPYEVQLAQLTNISVDQFNQLSNKVNYISDLAGQVAQTANIATGGNNEHLEDYAKQLAGSLAGNSTPNLGDFGATH